MLYDHPTMFQDVPGGEKPVVVAATSGLDYIARRRFFSLGKSMATTVSWRVADVGGFQRFELLVPEKAVDRVTETFLRDEDLSANALSKYWISEADRFFSLTRDSRTMVPPRHGPWVGSFSGTPVDKLVRLATSQKDARRARAAGYSLEKVAMSVRETTLEPHPPRAIDFFVLYTKGASTVVLRFQVLGGNVFGCGPIEGWPTDYGRGYRRHGRVEAGS
jgi:hypothetical protein